MATTIATLAGERTGLSDERLQQLQSQLRGLVVRPADPGYAEVRQVFNAMHPDDPAFAVLCSGTADVVSAVNFARENGLRLAVRGGGHSVAGLSAGDGGMLIDLSGMHGVHVDPEARIAHVQGGAILAEVDRETQAFGLATPLGAVSETGVAGLTLGGGYGYLRRKHGLSCDNLVSAEVVCADGKVRTASADTNADLFWAIRGGGGNFGIVTSFTFRLHPVGPMIAAATIFYAVEDAASVLRYWRAYTAAAPDEASSEAIALTFPAVPEFPEVIHDREVLVIAGSYIGDVEEGMRTLAPLAALGTPLLDASEPTPYTVLQSEFDPFFPRGAMQAYWKSQYLDQLSDAAIDTIAELAQTRPSPFTLVNLLQTGGAMNAVDPEATAFAERSASYLLSLDGNWDDPADNDANIAWVRRGWDRMREHGNGAIYLNFAGRSEEAQSVHVDSAFGRNLRRLAEIKAKYDPGNLFRLNNNIQPG